MTAIKYQALLTAAQEDFVEAAKSQPSRDSATRMALDVKQLGVFEIVTEGLGVTASYAALALFCASCIKVLAANLRMDEFSVLASALDGLNE